MAHLIFKKIDSGTKIRSKVPEIYVGTWRVTVYFLRKLKWIEFALDSILFTLRFFFKV